MMRPLIPPLAAAALNLSPSRAPLEQIADTADEKRQHGIPGQLPGLQIVIVQQAARPAGAIEAEIRRIEIIRR